MSSFEFNIFNYFVKHSRHSAFIDREHIIYLDAPPALCHHRLIQRSRSEECKSNNCTVEWLTKLENLHKLWFQKHVSNNKIHYIDGTNSPSHVLAHTINVINNIVNK